VLHDQLRDSRVKSAFKRDVTLIHLNVDSSVSNMSLHLQSKTHLTITHDMNKYFKTLLV